MLFPEDMREWVAEDSIVRFIIEAVEAVGEAGYLIDETEKEYSEVKIYCAVKRGSMGKRWKNCL
jgi:hypothetical protein